MTETGDGDRLARALEDMADVAFGVDKDARSRAGAAEIVGLMTRLQDIRLERWEAPAMAKAREGDDGSED
jgi:hypothetical protein